MKASAFLKKHHLEEGDSVEIKAGGRTLGGTIIPCESEGTVRLKLASGYNIGIVPQKVEEVKKQGKGKKVGKPPAKKVEKRKGLPKISILHTGGTIASRVDYRTGAVYSSFSPADVLAMFPELGKIANVESRLVRNMWSNDLRFEHISLIAKAVEKEAVKGVRGVIVGMGTDNLAVAAAGLAFALEKCPIPVLVVGAQRSSDRGSSDSAMNLVCAARFIAESDFAGVAICMHHSTADRKCAILPPCKTRKLHTSRRDAFKPVNNTPIALVDYNLGEINFLKKGYAKTRNEKVVAKPGFEEKVGLVKVTVNMFPEQFEFFSKHGFKGLVIEGTGLGHTPGLEPDEITKKAGHRKVFSAIEKFIKKGGVVVMTSQCIFGRVGMRVYNNAVQLMEMGVVPGEDMLPETALVKLAWLLGNYPPKEARKLVRENLRGEISYRTEIAETGGKQG